MAAAGKFRDRVTVLRQVDDGTLDRYGNAAAPEWDAVPGLGPFWADLRETPGKERLAAGRLEAPATATLRLRRSSAALTITPADVFQARGHVWNITGGPTDPDGRRRLLEFTLERGVAVE